MHTDSSTDEYTGPTGGSRTERVHQRLRDDVLSGRITPRTRLAEGPLARQHRVSRTPVREALTRLAADGLIERRDGAFFVVVPNLDELRDLYELQVTLELRGITRAIENPSVRHDHETLAIERDRWRELAAHPPHPDPDFVLRDESFHTELSRAAGNPALTEALRSVNQKVRRVRRYDFLTQDRIAATSREHLEITELTLAGDLDQAYVALYEHLGASTDAVRQRAEQALTRMALHNGVW
ncbi:GntR family transcriptional regulator [Actinophytocola sediminis]